MKKHLINFLSVIKRRINTKIIENDIRNIGIVAHIDAGKTTTTERMLFYSGTISSPGEVHHGNTVTDFLTQERERGITICSSAVSFPWKSSKINVLDTPGHIDFTMEVEQSLSAIDSVVIILDSSAGVEAQTVTVCNQADRFNLPKLVFVNKMDRKDSDFKSSVNDLKKKLNYNPVPIQWPTFKKSEFEGIIDIIRLNKLVWDSKTVGQAYNVYPLTDTELSFAKQKQIELIDQLSSHDDQLAELIISTGDMSTISEKQINFSLRNATMSGKIVPVVLGSAYKNIGVQTLLDCVITYLPSPNDRNEIFNCFNDSFAGKIFKVIYDKHKGALSLIRVLRGSLKQGSKMVTSKGVAEVVQKIYQPLADEYREVSVVNAGDIAALGGLKTTVTGDFLFLNQTSIKSAQKKLKKKMPALIKLDTDENDDELESFYQTLSPNLRIPNSVFFCSIEPPSLTYQLPLENALKQLQREDPSLKVKYDETTGQTILGGMGELHLDVIKSRLFSEHKIMAELGPLQIAYKETIEDDAREMIINEKEIAGIKQRVMVDMSIRKTLKTDEVFRLDSSPEASIALVNVRPRVIYVVKKGVLSALERGPRIGGEVVSVQILLHNLSIGRGTADSFTMATAYQCVQKILSNSSRLLEPIMALNIIAPTDKVSSILADLSRRRSTIVDINIKGENNKVIDVVVPLSELENYSRVLRTISSGTASIVMQPHGYTSMTTHDEQNAINKSLGLE